MFQIAELSVEISQLKDQNHNLQKDSSKLQVYVDDIVPRLNRKCKEGEEKLEALLRRLRSASRTARMGPLEA